MKRSKITTVYAILAFIFLAVLNVNAQSQSKSFASKKANKKVERLHEIVQLTPQQKKEIYTLYFMLFKYEEEVISDVTLISDAHRKTLRSKEKSTRQIVKGMLTEAQITTKRKYFAAKQAKR